jgi:hypothetical protein
LVFGSLEPGERGPPRVVVLMGDEFRMIGQSEPGLWVETRAIRPAHRLERQCQHHRISDERFKIYVVVLNLKLESFSRMIREKLLELDFDGLGDVDEASSALALGDRVDLGGDEDPLVHRLEAHVEIELGALLDGDDALAHRLADGDRQALLSHLARAVHEVADVQAER